MPGTLSAEAKVKCPFYIGHVPGMRQVSCTGITRGTTLTLRFINQYRMNAYMERRCMDIGRWEKCPYACVARAACEKACNNPKDGA